MNKKGFVMTETLVVTVFLVTIFTFVYVSIVPLMGRYEDAITREKDIDILYKLYHLRKVVYSDDNANDITEEPFAVITCSDLSNSAYCNKMVEYLELSNYLLVYVSDIYENRINIKNESTEMYEYIKKYIDDQGKYLILLDNDRHTICHLLYDDLNNIPDYYAFGDPTTSSTITTDYRTLNKHVFVGLRGTQKSVCILKDNKLDCFNNNNFTNEMNHIVEVFPDGCFPNYPTNIDCNELDVLSFFCSINSSGSVGCSEVSTGQHCSIDGNDVVECGID